MEYELAYYDSTVHHFNHYTTRRTPPELNRRVGKEYLKSKSKLFSVLWRRFRKVYYRFFKQLKRTSRTFKAVIKAGSCFIEENKIWYSCMMIFIGKCLFFIKIKVNTLQLLKFHLYIYSPNPSTRAGYDTRSIFKRSLTGLNSEFSFT